MIEEHITDLLEVKFQEAEFSDCFLIEIKHTNKKLEVFIDSDTGVTFEKCQKISRYLEQHIDEEGWLGEKYVLEVSSPGVSRPLTVWRQYPRNIGRKVEVTLNDGLKKTGVLLAVAEQEITIEEKIRIQEGKKKKTKVVQTPVPFDAIRKTVVKISF